MKDFADLFRTVFGRCEWCYPNNDGQVSDRPSTIDPHAFLMAVST